MAALNRLMRSIITWTDIRRMIRFVLLVMVAAFVSGIIYGTVHAQEAPQLSPQQLEEYVAILLYDRVQLLKEVDKYQMQALDQKRADDAKAQALADYWQRYVAGLKHGK